MTAPDTRDSAYLGHILDAIERIRRYVGRKRRAGFLRDPLLQDAVIRNIEIVGEAAGRLSQEFIARDPEIPWRDIVGTRHRLIHGYLNVNLDTVWEMVDRDLPELDRKLRARLAAPARPAVKRSARKPAAAKGRRPTRGSRSAAARGARGR